MNHVLPVVCLVTVISSNLVFVVVSNVICMIGMHMSIISHSMKDHMYGSTYYHVEVIYCLISQLLICKI